MFDDPLIANGSQPTNTVAELAQTDQRAEAKVPSHGVGKAVHNTVTTDTKV